MLPIIQRSVRLLGIESVMAPAALRQVAWDRLARELPMVKLNQLTTVEPMSKLPELAAQIVAGQTGGRVVIDVHR